MNIDRTRVIDLSSARSSRAAASANARETWTNHEEADHRIANHFSLLASVVSLRAADLARQTTDPSRTQVQLLLQAFRAQLDAVARLHRLLSAVGPGIGVDLGEQLHEVCTLLVVAVGGRVELTEDFEAGCAVRSDHLLPLTHIVAEVLTNAIKYAHPAGARCRILARCRHDAAGFVVIEIYDDGVGLPEGFDPVGDGGLGLRIVRGLAKQLGATVALESRDPGVRFRLTMSPGRPDRSAGDGGRPGVGPAPGPSGGAV